MIPIISTPLLLAARPSTKPCILAIVVLYKMALSESEAARTLLAILDECPDLARHFSLIIYDNSPGTHQPELPLQVSVHYRHDPTNAGLATAYNYALTYAEERGHEWLLVLDQDTSLTHEFILELIACAGEMSAQQAVGSLVPRLAVNGQIHSPAAHFIDQVRHQFKRGGHAASKDLTGLQQRRLGAYNSGATFKVSALRLIGGFPEEYWLDYLDHAVFHALTVHGFRMYVMKSMLEHDPSQAAPGNVPVWRERNLLFAQTRFVRQTGNFFDHLLYRIWLLRRSRGLLICYPDSRLWREAALQSLLLKKTSKDEKHGHGEITT